MKRIWLLVIVVLCLALVVSGCAKKPAKAVEKYKIGLVFDLAGRGDNSFNDSAYRGLTLIAKDYKGWIDGDPDKVNYGTEVHIKYLEPKAGGQDRETLMRAMAEDGYQLIFGVGFAFTDALTKVAKDFPKIHFNLIDGFVDKLTAESNITCLSFKENEGSFLVGAIAALKSGGKPIGFVGGVTIPLIQRFENGYKAGAMYVSAAHRKSGMILAQYISKEFTGFNDPTGGYNVSVALLKQGARILYHAAGGSGDGMFKACETAKKWGIGVDADQGLIYRSNPDAATQERGKWILTSMIKRVDTSVHQTAKAFIDNGGKLDGGYQVFGLAQEGVGYAENQYNQTDLADVKAQVDDLKAKIISGDIKVPDENTDMAAWQKTLK